MCACTRIKTPTIDLSLRLSITHLFFGEYASVLRISILLKRAVSASTFGQMA